MTRRERDLRLLRFLLRNCLSGVVAAWIALIAMVKLDIGGVGTLMANSPVGWVGYFMLAAGFAITGGAVGMGVAVFAQDQTGDRDDAPGYKTSDEG